MDENENCKSKSQYSWSWQHGQWKKSHGSNSMMAEIDQMMKIYNMDEITFVDKN